MWDEVSVMRSSRAARSGMLPPFVYTYTNLSGPRQSEGFSASRFMRSCFEGMSCRIFLGTHLSLTVISFAFIDVLTGKGKLTQTAAMIVGGGRFWVSWRWVRYE